MTEGHKYLCAECGRETCVSTMASCHCSVCKKDFCGQMSLSCYSAYHKKSGCKGHAQVITNPQWIINLRKTKDEEKKND